MKTLTIVLAAGVVTALITYALISVFELVGIMMGGTLTMQIGTFIGVLACMGFGSAALALLWRWCVAREDRARFQKLEQRVQALENGGATRG
ncbi:MAG: hypothetical protein FJ265_02140 [Planctomycetes bacterium]|nr:hypothetical protein [Planctomycetota bacterium]